MNRFRKILATVFDKTVVPLLTLLYYRKINVHKVGDLVWFRLKHNQAGLNTLAESGTIEQIFGRYFYVKKSKGADTIKIKYKNIVNNEQAFHRYKISERVERRNQKINDILNEN